MLALQMERDEAEQTVAQYTMGAGLEAMHRDGESRFYHYNDLGTALALTGANEAVTDTYRHDAWGVLLASTGGTVNPHTYVGRERYYRMPEAEMYHLGFRDYAQGLGRFTTVDPLGGGSEGYLYVRNRSGAHSDATGLLPVFWPHPELPDPPNGNGAEDRGEWLRDRLRELLGDLWDWWRGDPEMLYLCHEIVEDQRAAAREAAQTRYDQCVRDCWRDVGCSPPPAGWPGWPPVGKEELIAPIVAACIVMKCKPTLAADLTKAEILHLLDLQLCFFLYGFDPTRIMPPRGLWPIPRPLI